MDKSIVGRKIAMESELVRSESISILKEFDESKDLSILEDYSSDDSESADE